jgi:hypothetical protein
VNLAAFIAVVLACDDYSTRKVIGFSADGSVVVSRVNGEQPGPEWIRVETHRLPALELEQKWDVVTRAELEKPAKDGAIAKLRGTRWKAVEAELTGKGFVIAPNQELPSEGDSGNKSFRVEALGLQLLQPKSPTQGDECEHDLVLRAGGKERVVVANAVKGCSAMGAPWFERAYLARGGAHVVLVRRGACAEPTMVVVPTK